MNMIDVQDKLKGLSEQQLVQEMQAPSGVAPQFLVLSEITRRKRMRDSLQAQEQQPQTTVAEEMVAAAGAPAAGLGAMAQALAPKSSMAQNTAAMPQQPMPVQGMYAGGYVQKMAPGGIVVRNGRRYVEQEDGTLIDEVTGRPLLTAGQDIRNMFAGIGSLPSRAGAAVGSMSADMAGQMNEGLRAQSRALQGEAAFGMRAGPDTSYQYPPVPVPDMSSIDMVANALEGRSGFPTGMPSREEEAIRARNELLGNLVGRFDQQAAQDELMSAGGGRSGFPTVDLDLTQAPEISGDVQQGISATMDDELAIMEAERERLSGGTMLPSGKTLDEYTKAGEYGNTEPWYSSILSDIGNTATLLSPFASDEEVARAGQEMGAMNRGEPLTSGQAASAVQEATKIIDGAGGNTDAGGGDVILDGSGAGGFGNGGGGGGGLSAALSAASGGSSYEQELRDAMIRAEKRAEQDKWLALAQVGLNLMSSTQPTLGGAIGEAGVGGLEAFRTARDTYENERLGISKSLFEIEQQRAAALAAQRAASAKATGARALSLGELEDYYKALTTEVKTFDENGNEITVREPRNPEDRGTVAQIENAIRGMAISRIAPTM